MLKNKTVENNQIKRSKLTYLTILKYLAIFFVCLILSNAKLGMLSPFLFAFYFALIYVGLDEKICGIFVLSSWIVINPNLESFFIALTVVAIGIINFYIHKFSKRKIALVTNFIAYLISLVTYIYYNYADFKNLIFYLLLGIICLFVFTVVMQVMLLRKNCFKLTLDESICFLFFMSLLGVGLANILILNISFYRFIIMLAILLCVAVGSHGLTYVVALSLSFGVALSSFSLLPVAEFMVLAMLSSVFSMPNRFKIVFMVVISDIFIQYFFFIKDFTLIYELIPIVIACFIFLILPRKVLNNLSDMVYVKKSEITSRNLINTTRKNIRKRMSELSNVFLEMKQLHLSMIKKELNKDELIAMLNRELVSTCCKDCLDKNKCTRSLGTDNKSNMQLILETAVSKGKITLLDIPNGLTNRCSKVNHLISLVNRLCDEYRQYKHMVSDVNNVKILLADQMGAVSKLLLNLGDEIDTNVRFDIATENKIISRLLSHNIQCREVLLYAEKHNDVSVVIIVKADNVYNPILEKVITETLKFKMVLEKVVPMEDGEYVSVQFRKNSKYDCVFGLASCNKAGNLECGDCHSILRLGKDKFLLALCDGMGSGTKAHKISAMTLGLIENFYKAGFDNEIILESVNKLLAVNNQENYSTLDVCLLDLDKEIADFIKVGAPFGLIKRDNNIELVEGGALPIGALDSITPAVYKTTISTKDVVIMCTDGITDAFNGHENMIEFVSKFASTNPQTIAETILAEALRLNEMSAKDDMTVLVVRTYLKN